LASEVIVVEPTGADTQVLARFGSADISAVFRERHDFAPGATIRLMPHAGRAHLFDAASGGVLGQ
jgi:multiple sugar transport system ATP-binding protein